MIKNLTVGPPARLILTFTLPLLIGNLFQQLYSLTDALVVGRLLGVDALASVGATSSLVFLLIGFTWGSSAGLAIPVARAFGAGNMVQMRRAVVAGVYVSAGVVVFISLAGGLNAHRLLMLMNTPSELLSNSTGFLLVTFFGSATTVAFNFLSAIIRALGDSRTPLIFLVIACCLNAGLVVFYVGGLHLGVPGAALATVTAQLVSVVLCLIFVGVKMPALHIPAHEWRVQPAEVLEPAKMGLAMGFQSSIIALGTMIVQYAVNGLGAGAVAAFTAASRVDQVANAPLNSFGIALSTYAAQNRGAAQWRRIRTGVNRISLVAVAVALGLGSINIFFGYDIVSLFVGPGEGVVVGMAHQYLIVQGCSYVLLGLLFVLRGSLQGLGRAGVPTMAGVMELVFRAIAGLILVAHFGFIGVCFASPLAWVGSLATLSIAWISMRRWLIRQERVPVEGVSGQRSEKLAGALVT